MGEITGVLAEMKPLDLVIFLLIMGLAYTVFLIMTGRLLTRRALTDYQSTTEKRIEEIGADRDEWRTAARAEQQARIVLNEQVGDLLETARATDQLIRALPQALREVGRQ